MALEGKPSVAAIVMVLGIMALASAVLYSLLASLVGFPFHLAGIGTESREGLSILNGNTTARRGDK